MNVKGIIAQPEWERGLCPFCYEKLGKVETLRRKLKRICKCRSCGKIIDERLLIR